MNTQEMLKRMTAGNPELEHAIQDKMERTRLVRSLIVMRAKSGMSQAEVAKKMKCSQSLVSKIEHSVDEDISVGELEAYSKAVGCWFEISLSNTERNATGMIKHYLIRANELLERIIQLADDDKKMQMGSDQFSMEMLLDFCRLLDDSTKKIPNSSFQKILKMAQPETPSTFELNCDNGNEKDLVEA